MALMNVVLTNHQAASLRHCVEARAFQVARDIDAARPSPFIPNRAISTSARANGCTLVHETHPSESIASSTYLREIGPEHR